MWGIHRLFENGKTLVASTPCECGHYHKGITSVNIHTQHICACAVHVRGKCVHVSLSLYLCLYEYAYVCLCMHVCAYLSI